MKEVNAIIESVTMSNGDHGCLSISIRLSHGECYSQGFGGYALYNENQKVGVNACGIFIHRCLQVVGVTDWDDLVGRAVRIRHDDRKIYAVGHILKDDWFDPTGEFERLRNETKKD